MTKNKYTSGIQTIRISLVFITAIRVLIAVSRVFTRSGIQLSSFKPALRQQPFSPESYTKRFRYPYAYLLRRLSCGLGG